MTTYQHAEAYCLMKYVSKDHTKVEWLWNSRDGVSPFTVLPVGESPMSPDECKDNYMAHADFHEDVRVPFFVPCVGMRIFVDYNETTAQEAWEDHVARMARHGRHRPDVTELGKRWMHELLDTNQPNIVTVTEEVRQVFAGRALVAHTQGLRRPNW